MNCIVAAIVKLTEDVGYPNNNFEQRSFVTDDENISKI